MAKVVCAYRMMTRPMGYPKTHFEQHSLVHQKRDSKYTNGWIVSLLQWFE